MLRSVAVFAIVGALHYFLSVLGILFTLPAAFETQGGAGFWAAPGKSSLVWVSSVLLAPLSWLTPPLPLRGEFGFLDIGLVSALFGSIAVGLHYSWRLRRSAKT